MKKLSYIYQVIINNFMLKIKEVLLSKRFVSFYWSAGCMLAIGFLNLISESLTSFGLSGQMQVFFGLVLAQITKALSNFSQGKRA